MSVAVLTLVRGRDRQLANLLAGLDRQSVAPDEIVVALMQDDIPQGLKLTPPRRLVHVPGDPMPLARARNAAAHATASDLLIFLDVDCIPGPDLVARYVAAAKSHPGLLLGEVLYLSANPACTPVAHPSRPRLRPMEVRAETEHAMLWGLSFALPRAIWQDLGGMDENYVGYGAEETDLACRLGAAGVPVHWVGGAQALHQYHPIHKPPLQHFSSILRNAALFRRRWGRWCMEYWLDQFAQGGWIAWREDATAIAVLRTPSPDEIARSLQPPDILFS